jgi:hypothetical protein
MGKCSVRFLVAAALGLAANTSSLAQSEVHPGWDLLGTFAGTTFNGVPFVGVPLGSYNFGGTIGVQDVGATDTIVQRLGTASLLSPTIDIQLNALQLGTAVPTSIGGGPVGSYFITLQSARGGPASLGTMTFDFGLSTFTSYFDVYFDLRFGALDGPIVQSGDVVLSNAGTSWDGAAPSQAWTITGVNIDLNGLDDSSDFWPDGPFQEAGPGGNVHVVNWTAIPEPGAGALLLLGVALLGGRRGRAAAVAPMSR